jgi:hypothetical protein
MVDFEHYFNSFSESQSSSSPSIFIKANPGIRSHQAPKTTNNARQPPGYSSISTLVRIFRFDLFSFLGKPNVYNFHLKGN